MWVGDEAVYELFLLQVWTLRMTVLRSVFGILARRVPRSSSSSCFSPWLVKSLFKTPIVSARVLAQRRFSSDVNRGSCM